MGKIVAIGGGEIGLGETKEIDEYIVSISGKLCPKLLFIPTASNDAPGYIDVVKKIYGELGCVVSALCLHTENYTDTEIRDMIINSDIIYVGGGDTVRMMEKWRENKLDVYLREAYERDIVLAGISAGSICWFEFGHSDSDSFVNSGWWDYVRAYGLGFIKASHCPHYNEAGRESFDKMMEDEIMSGIALENNTAFVELNGTYKIIKSDKAAKAFLIQNSNGNRGKKEVLEGEVVVL